MRKCLSIVTNTWPFGWLLRKADRARECVTDETTKKYNTMMTTTTNRVLTPWLLFSWLYDELTYT